MKILEVHGPATLRRMRRIRNLAFTIFFLCATPVVALDLMGSGFRDTLLGRILAIVGLLALGLAVSYALEIIQETPALDDEKDRGGDSL